jgi:hypothetical protein
MATTSDAGVVLELYKLRTEETLRKARRFIGFEFWPKDLEELRAVTRNPANENNAYWRQVLSYWEMAAALVLRGAVDPDLFLDTSGEGIFVYAKFHHWHAESEKESGNKFMRNTATLIEKYPAAAAIHESVLKNLANRPK